MATARMDITFPDKDSAYGTLKIGQSTYKCLGKLGYKYPKDCTVSTGDKENPHFSSEFQCNMPYSIRVDGTRGIYIHEDITSSSGNLSHGNTHGCINLARGDAKQVYDWLQQKTRIVISYKW